MSGPAARRRPAPQASAHVAGQSRPRRVELRGGQAQVRHRSRYRRCRPTRWGPSVEAPASSRVRGHAKLVRAKPAGLRAADGGGAGHPLRPAVVHRRPGTPKGFNITSAELENALDEGMTFDGSAIDGFSRVQEADVLARPDPKTFQLLPWHQDDAAGGPGVLRHRQPRRHALRGGPPPRAAAHARAGPGRGLHLLRLARDRVLLLRRCRPGAGARSPSTRGRTSTSRWPT